jgi:hypothetical protein
VYGFAHWLVAQLLPLQGVWDMRDPNQPLAKNMIYEDMALPGCFAPVSLTKCQRADWRRSCCLPYFLVQMRCGEQVSMFSFPC